MRLQAARRGLLVQLAGIGDLVMAVPAIRALRRALPQVHWTLLTRPGQGALLAEEVDETISIAWPPSPGSLPATLRTLLDLRRQRFDVAIHLYRIGNRTGGVAIGTVFRIIRPELSIGRVTAASGNLFTLNWNEDEAGQAHETDRNLGLLRSLTLVAPPAVPSLTPDTACRQRLGTAIRQRADGAATVALFPGGARATRQWAPGNYEVLAGLLGERGVLVCAVGGKSDRLAGQRIVRGAGKRGWDLTGQLSLIELAALLSLVSAYAGNDSGPMHLAAAVGTPCVALFGPGDQAWIAPRGIGAVHVLRHPVTCAPCYLDRCGHHTCMRSLTVEQVYAAVMQCLDGAVPHIEAPISGAVHAH